MAWTEERRKKQSETIRKHKPWEKSTGPKTAKGKARAALNSIKTGHFTRRAKTLKEALLYQVLFINTLNKYHMLEHAEERILRGFYPKNPAGVSNELLKNPFKSD